MANWVLCVVLSLFLSYGGLCSCASAASVSDQAGKKMPHRLHVLHLPVRNLRYADAMTIAKKAADLKYNALIIGLYGGVRLKTFPNALPDSWSREELATFADYARKNGMEIIPEIALLTHQEWFLGKSRPDLMFDEWTYDPRKPGVYEAVFSLLNEIIDLLHPRAIHIGHDEVNGVYQAKKLGILGPKMLPADLFLLDVVTIHDYLKKKAIETWMWGDMLISSDEFPEMDWRHLNGIDGYGKAVRQQLPRDITICDWHYADEQREFPSVLKFKNEGFRVLGATFKNTKTIYNFSRYAYGNGADGMIATTWYHLMRREWDIVDRIMHESADAFNNVN